MDEHSSGDDTQGEPDIDVDLSTDGFEHPDDDEIEVTNMDDIPEVNSAEDAVDGDLDKKERLQKKAEELKAKAEAEEAADDESDDEDEGTPVKVGNNDDGPVIQQAGESDTDADEDEEEEGSLFTPEESEQIEEEMGDFDLEPLEDVPDDFDYEDQDTEQFGVTHEQVDIEHNGVIFRLEQPTGMREDKFWSEMQTQGSLSGLFDVLIKYTVTRPKNIHERMEAENWSGFAKAGLAMKCSSFLGLDALQDF